MQVFFIGALWDGRNFLPLFGETVGQGKPGARGVRRVNHKIDWSFPDFMLRYHGFMIQLNLNIWTILLCFWLWLFFYHLSILHCCKNLARDYFSTLVMIYLKYTDTINFMRGHADIISIRIWLQDLWLLSFARAIFKITFIANEALAISTIIYDCFFINDDRFVPRYDGKADRPHNRTNKNIIFIEWSLAKKSDSF